MLVVGFICVACDSAIVTVILPKSHYRLRSVGKISSNDIFPLFSGSQITEIWVINMRKWLLLPITQSCIWAKH